MEPDGGAPGEVALVRVKRKAAEAASNTLSADLRRSKTVAVVPALRRQLQIAILLPMDALALSC